MVVGSLFSGIGGFDLGLERAGHNIAWQVELDEACQSVLKRRFLRSEERDQQGQSDDGAPERSPDAARSGPVGFADVRTVGRRELAPVDLVCGGFPCQDLSVAGKRAGLAGARSGLWHEFARVLAELTPQWVLIENVPGLLSSNEGRDMGVILGRLAELGYGWAYRVLDAQYFGVAQRRRRVFIVGCLGSPARAAAVLFESESCDGDTPPSRSTRKGVAASLTSGSGVGSNDPGRRREDDVNLVPALTAGAGTNAMSPGYNRDGLFIPDVAWALQERDAKGSDSSTKDGHLLVTHTLRSEGGDASEDGTGRGTPLVVQGGAQQDQFVGPDGVVPTLAHSSNTHSGHHQPMVAAWTVSENSNGFAWESEQYPTLQTSEGSNQQAGLRQNMAVRRLTPTECERLQGFPDGWTAGQSDSVRYRQLGNAVCVPVAEWIGRRFK